jgi:hypothetical protein
VASATAEARRQRPARHPTSAAPITSSAPRPIRMVLTGRRETRTNPVRTVPTMAPKVPTPDSRPTTVPVSARLVSRSFVTNGVTAESSAPGTRSVADATSRSSAGDRSAVVRSSSGVSATTTPDTPSAGPMSRCGSTWSAMCPPSQEPRAMAVRAMPITIVLVSRVRPRYGARSRRATISTTRTAADDPNTRTAATRGPGPRSWGGSSPWGESSATGEGGGGVTAASSHGGDGRTPAVTRGGRGTVDRRGRRHGGRPAPGGRAWRGGSLRCERAPVHPCQEADAGVSG